MNDIRKKISLSASIISFILFYFGFNEIAKKIGFPARVHGETTEVGDYILIEHGRWTRKMDIDVDGEEITLHRVDIDAILAVSDEKPNELQIGAEFSTAPDEHKPEDFGAR